MTLSVEDLSPLPKLKARLLGKYLVSAAGCWEYTGGLDRCGYGKFAVGKRRLGAHKVSYVVHVGSVGPGQVVMHTCDNPSCINPDHLRLGTVRDNVSDCINKNRFNATGLSKNRGPLRKIVGWNDQEVLEFADVYALKQAGFSDGHVSEVANGKSDRYRGYCWRYV